MSLCCPHRGGVQDGATVPCLWARNRKEDGARVGREPESHPCLSGSLTRPMDSQTWPSFFHALCPVVGTRGWSACTRTGGSRQETANGILSARARADSRVPPPLGLAFPSQMGGRASRRHHSALVHGPWCSPVRSASSPPPHRPCTWLLRAGDVQGETERGISLTPGPPLKKGKLVSQLEGLENRKCFSYFFSKKVSSLALSEKVNLA